MHDQPHALDGIHQDTALPRDGPVNEDHRPYRDRREDLVCGQQRGKVDDAVDVLASAWISFCSRPASSSVSASRAAKPASPARCCAALTISGNTGFDRLGMTRPMFAVLPVLSDAAWRLGE